MATDEAAATNGGESGQSNALNQKIVTQLEYYFGDQNIVRDKFLVQKISEDDGWVTIDCLTTFNRLKALTTDHDVIIEALKQGGSGLIEVHEDKTKLRRTKDRPLPDINDPFLKKLSHSKTVYVKGFPENATLDDIEDFVAKYGKTVFIKMKRLPDKKFKGSIFCEFKTVEEANKLLEDKELKYGDIPLIKMLRDDYMKMKNEESKKHKENRNSNKVEENQKDTFEAGCILRFEGCGEGVSREDLKALFGKHEEVQWVDFNRNDSEGYLRFRNSGGAQRAVDGVKAENDDKVMLNDNELTVRVLQGEEEEEYWKKVRQASKISKERKRGNRAPDRRGRKSKYPRRNERKDQQQNDDTKNTHITFDSDDDSKSEEVKSPVKRSASDDIVQPESKQAKVEEE